jgi:hypothetical protein
LKQLFLPEAMYNYFSQYLVPEIEFVFSFIHVATRVKEKTCIYKYLCICVYIQGVP